MLNYVLLSEEIAICFLPILANVSFHYEWCAIKGVLFLFHGLIFCKVQHVIKTLWAASKQIQTKQLPYITIHHQIMITFYCSFAICII